MYTYMPCVVHIVHMYMYIYKLHVHEQVCVVYIYTVYNYVWAVYQYLVKILIFFPTPQYGIAKFKTLHTEISHYIIN